MPPQSWQKPQEKCHLGWKFHLEIVILQGVDCCSSGLKFQHAGFRVQNTASSIWRKTSTASLTGQPTWIQHVSIYVHKRRLTDIDRALANADILNFHVWLRIELSEAFQGFGAGLLLSTKAATKLTCQDWHRAQPESLPHRKPGTKALTGCLVEKRPPILSILFHFSLGSWGLATTPVQDSGFQVQGLHRQAFPHTVNCCVHTEAEG